MPAPRARRERSLSQTAFLSPFSEVDQVVPARFAWRVAVSRYVAVLAYGAAMAYVESAAVLYLRTIYGGVDPVGPRRTPFDPLPDFALIEIVREAATMVMLAMVGWLAGRGTGGRFGAFLAAFGIWDIFYYVFLWLFAGWPSTLFAPDVLFLIPLPWWGPVLAPVLIALLMVIGGGFALARDFGDGVPRLDRVSWAAMTAGALLCLVAFMADALAAVPLGLDAAFSVRGGPFPWAVYLPGLALGAWGAWRAVSRPAGSVRSRSG